jgi:hypothetical protein
MRSNGELVSEKALLDIFLGGPERNWLTKNDSMTERKNVFILALKVELLQTLVPCQALARTAGETWNEQTSVWFKSFKE